MLKVSIEVRSQVEITEIVSYDSTICNRIFKETSIFERRQTRIMNCNFTMPNFSETRTRNKNAGDGARTHDLQISEVKTKDIVKIVKGGLLCT